VQCGAAHVRSRNAPAAPTRHMHACVCISTWQRQDMRTTQHSPGTAMPQVYCPRAP
jgi:hypothetical protein